MLYILVYVLLFKRNVLFVSIFTILTNTLFCNVPVMNFNSNILQILVTFRNQLKTERQYDETIYKHISNFIDITKLITVCILKRMATVTY